MNIKALISAVALANLDILEREDLVTRVDALQHRLGAALLPLAA